jgi:Bromodomain/Bromodomain extra-terminal - transcription regulation
VPQFCAICFSLYTEPFRERVDYEAFGLADYPLIIKKPMDLGLILKKLEQKQYRTLYECADDVRLVWTNCMTYNADGSDFYILASNLSRRWEEKYSKMLTEFGLTVMMMPPSSSSAPKENTLTLEEKRTFARDLYKIQKDELGVVLMELVEKSPAAITKNAAEDEFEINVDKIDAGIFAELTAYIQTCLSKKKKNPKKAMKTS